jgi:hypothetical protein
MRISRKAYVRGHFYFSPHSGRGYSKILHRRGARVAWQSCPRRNPIAVAFVEPVTEGLEFPREDWPLHITLVKFDVDGAESPPEAAQEAAPGDPLAGWIASLIERGPSPRRWAAALPWGGEAGFGRTRPIPGSLIEPGGPLQGPTPPALKEQR